MFNAMSYEFDDADEPGDPEFKLSNHFLNIFTYSDIITY